MSALYQNTLLYGLSEADTDLLRPNLEPVGINVEDRIAEPFEPITHVYFPESGLLSVISSPDHRDQIEVAIVGREGMSGVSVVLGCFETPFRTFVQRPGHALRITRELFMHACEASAGIRDMALRYAQAFTVQVAEGARSNARYGVEARLARWLLLAHDRTDGDEINLTHEFLALMLGVRRPGVTVATHVLEGHGLIKARRGSIRVLDRKRLEDAAMGSYGSAEAEYDRLFPLSAKVLRAAA